jgi:inosose dehydratase
MQLSGSNYGMPTLPIDEALAFHDQLGFRAMELTVLPNYATALERFDAAERQRVRGLFRQYAIVCSGVANFQSLAEPDPAAAAAILAHHRGAVDLAVDLATGDRPPVVPFMSGGAPEDWPAARSILIDRIGSLAEYARSRGVVLTLKAHSMGAVRRPHHLVDLFEQIDSPAFRFCFDMSHFEVQGLTLVQAMYPLLALSEHVEIKGSIGHAPDHEYMIPGEPNLQSDFAGQFRALRALGYRGYLVPEMSVHVMQRPNYDPYAALCLSHDFLTELLREELGRAPG